MSSSFALFYAPLALINFFDDIPASHVEEIGTAVVC